MVIRSLFDTQLPAYTLAYAACLKTATLIFATAQDKTTHSV